MKKILFLILVLSTIYAGFIGYKLIVKNKTPFVFKCEGLILNKNSKYFITNKKNIGLIEKVSNTKVNPKKDYFLNYTESKDWIFPSYIGYIHYDSLKKDWQMELANSVLTPQKRDNPFVPFARFDDNKLNYIDNKTISNKILQTGVVINCVDGDSKSRMKIKLDSVDGDCVLKFNRSGVNTSFRIYNENKAKLYKFYFNKNKIDTINTSNYNFSFSGFPIKESEYTVGFNSKKFNSFDFSILNENGTNEKFSSMSKKTFNIERVLLSIKPTFSSKDLSILGIYFLSLFFSSLLFLFLSDDLGKNPFQKSIVYFVVIINIFGLLGFPLLLATLKSNSGLYAIYLSIGFNLLIGLLLLTYTRTDYFDTINLYSKFDFFKKEENINTYFIVFSIFLLIFLPIYHFITYQERVLSIFPALHAQKIILLFAFYLFSNPEYILFLKEKFSKILSKVGLNKFGSIIVQKVNNFNVKIDILSTRSIAYLLMIIYSLSLSIVSKDFGSFVFSFMTISLLLMLEGIHWGKFIYILFFLVIYSGLIYLAFNWNLDPKLYRLVYTVQNPDYERFISFSMDDRQTFSNFIYVLKSIVSNPFGHGNDIDVLSSAKSTAHSDFAYLWSSAIGGVPFIILSLIAVLTLIFNIGIIIVASVKPLMANKFEGQYTILHEKKYSRILSFWLIITLLQFLYQVFSNLMLYGTPLTGIPMPFISVGKGDPIILCSLIIVLILLFFKNSQIRKEFDVPLDIINKKKYFSKEIGKLKLFVLFLGFVLTLLFGIKVFALKETPNSLRLKPNVKDDTVMINEYNKIKEMFNGDKSKIQNYLIEEANKILKGRDLESLNSEEKKLIKPLHYMYYRGETFEIDDTHPRIVYEKSIYNKISIDKQLKNLDSVVSGRIHPYGIVKEKTMFFNNKKLKFVDNELYSKPDFVEINNRDLSAILNDSLQKHISRKIGDSLIMGTIMINKVGNNENDFEAIANYPLKSNAFVTPYNVGSVKKSLIFYSATKLDSKYLTKIFDFTPSYAMMHSKNPYFQKLAYEVINTHNNDLDNLLKDKFNMAVYSNSFRYLDRPLENKRDIDLITIYKNAIGAFQKHTLYEVANWYEVFLTDGNDAQFLKILHLPLEKGGTADFVGEELKKLNVKDFDSFIAKTGTLEDNWSGNKVNVSSSFVIANKEYIVSIGLFSKNGDRIIPDNSEKLGAKHLFKNILPTLVKYGIFQTN